MKIFKMVFCSFENIVTLPAARGVIRPFLVGANILNQKGVLLKMILKKIMF